jgi:hypothetical protein
MTTAFLALHPDPVKQGVSVEKAKYDMMRAAILDVLRERGPMSFMKLNAAVERRLKGAFDGSVPWYFVTVKLDLEARGEIRRVPNSKPQVIEIV